MTTQETPVDLEKIKLLFAESLRRRKAELAGGDDSAGEAGEAAEVDPAAAEEVKQTAQAVAAAAPNFGVLDEKFLMEAFDEVLKENPAVAELTPEEIQELIDEIVSSYEPAADGEEVAS
jgi:hypothetical protein